MKIYPPTILILIFSCVALGQFHPMGALPPEKKCSLRQSDLPAVAKLKLGMSGREIKKHYPVKNPTTEFPAALNPAPDIAAIGFSVEKDKLLAYHISYKPVWKSLDEFSQFVAKSLAIKIPASFWRRSDMPGLEAMLAKCEDFSIAYSSNDHSRSFTFEVFNDDYGRF